MNYVNLPGTSVKISRVGLGTMMLGDQISEADSFPIIDYAFDKGITRWQNDFWQSCRQGKSGGSWRIACTIAYCRILGGHSAVRTL